MKIGFNPKTYLGKLSIVLLIGFFLFFNVFLFFVNSGEKGGESFFCNLKLVIPFLISVILGISGFFTGLISIIKKRERSFWVILSTIAGFLVLLFTIGELFSKH